MKPSTYPLILLSPLLISAELLRARGQSRSDTINALADTTQDRNRGVSAFPKPFSFASLKQKRQLECEIPTDHLCGAFCCADDTKCASPPSLFHPFSPPPASNARANTYPSAPSIVVPSSSWVSAARTPSVVAATSARIASLRQINAVLRRRRRAAGAIAMRLGLCAARMRPRARRGRRVAGRSAAIVGTFAARIRRGVVRRGISVVRGLVCCPEGSECSDTFGYCLHTVTSQSVSPTPTTASESASATSSLPSVSTPKLPSSSTSPSTTTGCRTAAAGSLQTGSTGVKARQNLPVMEYPYVAVFNDDIPKNICLGMKHKTGQPVQEMILTYAGDGEKCARKRGRQSGCPGCCSGVRKVGGPHNGDITTCDEFPFKSTVEGGTGAWTSCVVGWQNDLQGTYIRSWNALEKLNPGDQFIVRVTGLDCSTVAESDLQGCGGAIRNGKEKRSADLPTSGFEATVRPSIDNSSNVVVIPFGDLGVGNYSTRAQLMSGHLTDLFVIDNEGAEMALPGSLDALSSEGVVLNWNSDDFSSGVGLVGLTQEKSVNLSYQFAVNSTLPSATPSSTKKPSGAAPLRTTYGGILIGAGVGFLMWLV